MITQLHGLHRKTYDALFQDPVARNLEWQEVRSMLVALADAVEEDSDSLRIKRNGKTLVLHRPQSAGFEDLETLMQVRGFLKQSVAPLRQPEVQSLHLVVVIDDERARVYRTRFQESVPQRIMPYHPAGMARHLEITQNAYDGSRHAERKHFYQVLAKILIGAETILVLGGGTEAMTAMRQLLIELGHHHRNVAKRIIGALVVHEPHLTEQLMLKKSRAFYLPQVRSI
jgi:hypothetical protein